MSYTRHQRRRFVCLLILSAIVLVCGSPEPDAEALLEPKGKLFPLPQESPLDDDVVDNVSATSPLGSDNRRQPDDVTAVSLGSPPSRKCPILNL